VPGATGELASPAGAPPSNSRSSSSSIRPDTLSRQPGAQSLLDLSEDLLAALIDALAESPPACVAFASTCAAAAACSAAKLATLRQEAEAAAKLRPWSDPARPWWSFTAHVKRGVAAWRGCWNLHVGADCRCVLAHRVSPSATKETRWYGVALGRLHTAERGGLVACFSHVSFSVPFQLPWRTRRPGAEPIAGIGSVRALASRRARPPDGATEWLLFEDGTLGLGEGVRLDLAIAPASGEALSAASLGLVTPAAEYWLEEGVEVNWLQAVAGLEGGDAW